MALKYLFLGIFVKLITGLDDTITNVPVLASVAKTRMGKIAFSLGTLLAIITAILISFFFASVLRNFEYYRYIAAGLVFALALAIYFDVFVHTPRTEAEQNLLKKKRISVGRFTKIFGVGYVASIATVLDDIIAYMPLFLGSTLSVSLVIIGILLATLLEVFVVIYFADKIAKFKYKEELASAGLVLIGILILTGTI